MKKLSLFFVLLFVIVSIAFAGDVFSFSVSMSSNFGVF